MSLERGIHKIPHFESFLPKSVFCRNVFNVIRRTHNQCHFDCIACAKLQFRHFLSANQDHFSMLAWTFPNALQILICVRGMNKTNFRKFEIENMFGSENAQKSCLQFSACRQRRKLIILSNLIENGIEGMAVGSTCGKRRNEKLKMARLRGLRDPPKRQKTVNACRGVAF